MKVIIRRAFASKGWHIWLYEDDGGKSKVIKPFTVETLETETHGGAFALPEPTFNISPEAFNEFLESSRRELRVLGVESSSIEHAAELKATKYHLEDMRKIAIQATTKFVEVKE